MALRHILLCSYLLSVYKIGTLSADSRCSWTDEERKLHCCVWEGAESSLSSHILDKCSAKLNYPLPEVAADTVDPCSEECAWEHEFGLTPEGRIDVEAMLKRAHDQRPQDTEFFRLFKLAVKHCFKPGVVWDDDDNHQCKSGAYKAVHCIDSFIFFNCPKSNWANSGACDAAVDKMKRCTLHYLMRPDTVTLKPAGSAA